MPAPDPDPVLAAAAERFGTPCYVYFTDRIEARLADLRAAFGRWFTLSYAVKSNPNPALLAWLEPRVDLLDVSSGGEFQLANAAGWAGARASFTGPAKREAELRAAMAGGIGEIVIESPREARIISALAQESGRPQPVLIRISPAQVPKGFGDHMAGRPSPFGIDIEDAGVQLPEILALPGLHVAGFHIYSGTQSLKPAAICENWRGFIALFRQLCADHGVVPEKLVFGSGLGIPYHLGDVALNLSEIAAEIAPDLDALKAEPTFGDTRLVLELGRHLVGEAGFFVTRVVSVKQSRGNRIAICDGGMNAHLAASGHFGMVLKRNYLLHRVGPATPGAEEKIDITGPLCTSIDRLASAALLPPVAEGDLIAIHGSGAYGPTASPLHFISHPQPREVLAEGGQLRDVTWLG